MTRHARDGGITKYPLGWPHPDAYSEQCLLSGLGEADGITPMMLRARWFHTQNEGFDTYEPVRTVPSLFQYAEVADDLRGMELGRLPYLSLSLTFELFSSAFAAVDAVFPMPGPAERALGRHVVVVVGQVDNELIVFLHGWDPAGTGGSSGMVERPYLDRYFVEAFASRSFPGPSLGDDELPFAASGSTRRRWWTEEHHWTHPDRQRRSLARWRRGASSTFEITAERLWSLNGRDRLVQVECHRMDSEGPSITVGWMYLRLCSSEAIVEEYFVWPPYRCGGIGTALASHAALNLATHGFRHVRWEHFAADTLISETGGCEIAYPKFFRDLPWRMYGVGEGGPFDRCALVDLHDILITLSEPDGS